MDETNTPKGEKFLKETGTVMRYKTLYKTKYDVELILVNFSQKKKPLRNSKESLEKTARWRHSLHIIK